jgi:predicted MFS family arabinose efflux permease
MPELLTPARAKQKAYRFVLLIGIVSFFADFTYEGSRSITGPFLAVLGASATLVGIIAGGGELLGYALRLVSGSVSERTGRFWPITLFGYFVQMTSVPLLALAPNWQIAGVLIILERVGRAIRNPPRDVMLSHAAKHMGFGWAFGLHEAMDQAGAMVGPLVMSLVLSFRGEYRTAFAVLFPPAAITLGLLLAARFIYPRPEDLEPTRSEVHATGLPRVFWIYLIGAAFVAAGFADFSLIAFHFEKTAHVRSTLIPVFYSVAMGVSGAGSLVFGKLFDRVGISILIPLTVISAVSAPLVFLGGFWLALAGAALWGLGMGVHESIIPAAVALMVPAQRRPLAYGLFTAGYGVFWFAGSVVVGVLYDVSLVAVVAFSVGAELAAIPIFFRVKSLLRDSQP